VSLNFATSIKGGLEELAPDPNESLGVIFSKKKPQTLENRLLVLVN
jgi:hypothetical protein